MAYFSWLIAAHRTALHYFFYRNEQKQVAPAMASHLLAWMLAWNCAALALTTLVHNWTPPADSEFPGIWHPVMISCALLYGGALFLVFRKLIGWLGGLSYAGTLVLLGSNLIDASLTLILIGISEAWLTALSNGVLAWTLYRLVVVHRHKPSANKDEA